MRLRDLLGQSLEDEDFELSAKEVRQIMGIDAAIFQQWLARGLIPFRSIKAGKRTWRRFHVSDIPRMVLISQILLTGLPIGEVVDAVNAIMKWKYKEGVIPGDILWLRHIQCILFAESRASLAKILRENNCAICIHLNLAELQWKIQNALATTKKNRREAKA